MSNCHNIDNLTGQRFGRLLVLCRDEACKAGHAKWICRCDCGNVVSVFGSNMKRGTSLSCGCLSKELLSKRRTSHGACAGGKNSRLYNVWRGIKKRCKNDNDPHYKDYGGRGIQVCEDWAEFCNFEKWAIDAGYNSDAEYGRCTIDRIDVNGNYCPENCRWVDSSTQQNNRRSCIYVEYKGETHTLKEWSIITDISYQTIYGRYKRGWPVDKLLSR